MKNQTSKKAGFTLIEILIAIAIAAAVAAVIIPNLLGARGQANNGMAIALQNQLNSTYQQWVALGGEHSGTATADEDLTVAILDVLTADADAFQSADISTGTDVASDGPRSTDPVNSSAIRTQLNDGTYTADATNGDVDYSNFNIVFSTSTGAFAVTVQ
jgi:prepilin-type N-terminal cleavage/methylation domain-containing protein